MALIEMDFANSGGVQPTFEQRDDIAPNVSYDVTLKNGFVVLQNYYYDKGCIWVEIVVQDGEPTLIYAHTYGSYSYNNGVLTVKNTYTGYGNDRLVTYIVN